MIRKIFGIAILFFLLIPASQAATGDTEPIEWTVKQGKNLTRTILAKNVTNQGLSGASCAIDIFNSTDSKIIDNLTTADIGDGLYRFTINTTATGRVGNYYGVVVCTSGTLIDTQAFEFKVVSETTAENIDTTEESIETTIKEETEEVEDTVKDKTKETNKFISDVSDFLQGEFMKGIFIVIGIIVFIGVVIVIRRLVKAPKEDYAEQ